APSLLEAKRNALRRDRQESAGSEIDANPDNVDRGNARLTRRLRHRPLDTDPVVRRVLQCPIVRQRLGAVRESGFDDPVRVRRHRGAQLRAVGNVDDEGADRLRAEIESKGAARHYSSSQFKSANGSSAFAGGAALISTITVVPPAPV